MSASDHPKTIAVRTAVLYAVILFLGQLLITQWTVEAADNKDVIDYVSFAGTLTSMLLAVLAIVYSYYTTTAQKSDADRIATQIGSLSATAQTLSASEIGLANELQRLAEIRVKLDQVAAHVQASDARSLDIQKALLDLKREKQAAEADQERSAAEVVAVSGPDDTQCLEFAVRKIAEDVTDRQLPCLYAAYECAVLDMDLNASADRNVKANLKDQSTISEMASYGEVYTYVMLLLQFGVYKKNATAKVFMTALRERIERFLEEGVKVKRFDDERLTKWLSDRIVELNKKGAE